MKSSLDLVKEVGKDFNITKEKQLHARQQMAFVTSQAQEQRGIIFRLLYDSARARRNVEEAKDDTTRSAHVANLSKYEDDLRQLSKTLDFTIELEKQLQAETGLEAKIEDHPEGSL